MKTKVSGDLKKKRKKKIKKTLKSFLCTTTASQLGVTPLTLRDTWGLWGCRTRGGGQRSWRLQCRDRDWWVRSLQIEGVKMGSTPMKPSGSTANYVVGAWLRLWGWSCCRFCCSCTASCWDWSDVESLLINADTQFAGMISPGKQIQGWCWHSLQILKEKGFGKYAYRCCQSERKINTAPMSVR